MAIIENISTEYGDKLIIRANAPIIGLISLTDFIDDTSGENAQNSFNKRFRYSVDGGISFTPWEDLTTINLQSVSVDSTEVFIIEYEYEHVGSGAEDLISFQNISLEADFTPPPNFKTYNNSIFGELFSHDSIEVMNWCLNVTEKLYNKGIVASYITRGDEGNINSIDKDYLDYWRTVACFFAYIVILSRNIGNFKKSQDILLNFLEQRNLLFCDKNTQQDLEYIAENYYDEARKRGTSDIYKSKKNGAVVDGELLRLICFNSEIDEFIINLHLPHTIGWSVGNSSPLYKGLQNQVQANKSYEKFKDINDLNLYPTVNVGNLSIVTDGDKSVLDINDVNSGIGGSNFNYLININPFLDYEISFFVKKKSPTSSFTFGANAYDSGGSSVDLLNISTDAIQNNFMSSVSLPLEGNYYHIRGIIYGSNKGIRPYNNTPAIGAGSNLYFPSEASAIIPQIIGDVRVWGISIKPLANKYSSGFILPKNHISFFFENKNGKYSDKQVESYMRRFLLPYNSTFNIKFLQSTGSNIIGDFSPLDFDDSFSF